MTDRECCEDCGDEDCGYGVLWVEPQEASELDQLRAEVEKLRAENAELKLFKESHSKCSVAKREAVKDNRIAELEAALKTIPFGEYSEAQREGCDSNGAWDCFLEAADEHIKKALGKDGGHD